jgi:hypothetical protein
VLGLAVLLSAPVLLGVANARAADDKPPSYGLFGKGFHVEAGVGVYQALSTGGLVPGLYPRANLELELGPHISIPVSVRMQQAVDPKAGVPDFAQLSVAPGLLIRFREKEWPVAFSFGPGARIGSFTASKKLVGNYQQTTEPGAQKVFGFPIAPEINANLEVWLGSFLVIKVGASYAPIFVKGEGLKPVHTIEESATLGFVF